MKINFLKRKSKALVDYIMISCLLGCAVSTSVFEKAKEALRNGADSSNVFHWGTSHCIISIVLVAIIIFHIYQHWGYIKSVFVQKLFLKNKITTLALLFFILTVISFSLYLSGFTMPLLHFHSLITHLFVLLAIIHLVMNFKKLLSLSRKKQ
jgi:hypothetical protein